MVGRGMFSPGGGLFNQMPVNVQEGITAAMAPKTPAPAAATSGRTSSVGGSSLGVASPLGGGTIKRPAARNGALLLGG